MAFIRKKVWFCAVLLMVAVGLLAFVPAVQVEYHKGRLHALKEKRDRYMTGELTRRDRFLLEVTGAPAAPGALARRIEKHESALVRLGFLARENLPAKMVAECAETGETLAALEKECPWYHADTVAQTTLVVTACPKMMAAWRARAKELGW